MKLAIQQFYRLKDPLELAGLRELFKEKRENLEFSPETDFPDHWQILLDASYGMLFDPCLAATAFEALFYKPKSTTWYLQSSLGLLQTSILHPNILKPCNVLEIPLIYPNSDYNLQAYQCYAIGRLLALAKVSELFSSSFIKYEFDILKSFVEDFHLDVYNALLEKDNDLLLLARDRIFNLQASKFFNAWWKIYFLNNLD